MTCSPISSKLSKPRPGFSTMHCKKAAVARISARTCNSRRHWIIELSRSIRSPMMQMRQHSVRRSQLGTRRLCRNERHGRLAQYKDKLLSLVPRPSEQGGACSHHPRSPWLSYGTRHCSLLPQPRQFDLGIPSTCRSWSSESI